MQRDIIAKLNAWKASEYRKPLILKGARQVGKTWALKEFGRTSYRNFVYLTLEEPSPGVQSEYAQFFEGTRDPRRIISNLSLALGQPIEPGETLLIIDEIQDCPSAVGALKYFCDEAPEYHVACAGSLLGVRLSRETSAFPVGKVEFMEMRPMSFSEFLKAEGAAKLRRIPWRPGSDRDSARFLPCPSRRASSSLFCMRRHARGSWPVGGDGRYRSGR